MRILKLFIFWQLLDGNSEHTAQAWWKTVLFWIYFQIYTCFRFQQMPSTDRIPNFPPHTCVHISELPSNITWFDCSYNYKQSVSAIMRKKNRFPNSFYFGEKSNSELSMIIFHWLFQLFSYSNCIYQVNTTHIQYLYKKKKKKKLN